MKTLLVTFFSGLVYVGIGMLAMGQDINNATLNINERIDNEVQTRQAESQAAETKVNGVSLVAAPTAGNPAGVTILSLSPDSKLVSPTLLNVNPSNATQVGGEYSGFTEQRKTGIYNTQYFLRNNFGENNSFLGKGVLDSYRADTGVVLKTDFGLVVQPYFTYKYGSRDLVGANTFYSDTYGGTLSFSQKVFPFVPLLRGQPGATYNLRKLTSADFAPSNCPKVAGEVPLGIPDIFPNFDIIVGTDLSFADAKQTTVVKGNRVKTSQNSYDISPNVAFDFNLSKHFTVTLAPTYAADMTSTSVGTSSSGGTLQVQDRNAFSWNADDCDPHSDSFSIVESNSINHDTNIEPTTRSPSGVPYQNWATFGVGFGYTKLYAKDRHLIARINYSYDAFNAAYENQSVTTSINIDF